MGEGSTQGLGGRGESRERENLSDLGVDGRRILTWAFK